jgi:hypothetical protein
VSKKVDRGKLERTDPSRRPPKCEICGLKRYLFSVSRRERTTEGRVCHAVFAGFQMARQPFLESRIGIGLNGDVVPTVELIE